MFRWSKIDLFVNSLEDKLGITLSMKTKQSLRTVQVSSTLPQQIHHEHVEILRLQISLELDSNTLNQFKIVDLFIILIIKESRIIRKNTLHIKRIQPQNLSERSATLLCLNYGSKLVNRPQPVLQRFFLVGRHQVNLIQKNHIGKCHLLKRLIDRSIRLNLVQMLSQMLTIRQTDNAINFVIITHLGICLDGVNNGCRVGEAGRFEEDGIEIFSARGELSKGADEVTAD
mmetsp:Transcript_30842/g.57147  ORF Transcript_30842/g.57147 Transcript_30842/m.57147 type:complete len:229 (+) Transcript_30842:338-1024(+)